MVDSIKMISELLERCRVGEQCYGNRREAMKKSVAKRVANGSLSVSPTSTSSGTATAVSTTSCPLTVGCWLQDCEALVEALKREPPSLSKKLKVAEARYLCGVANLKTASQHRASSPKLVDELATGSLWRACVQLMFAKKILCLLEAKVTRSEKKLTNTFTKAVVLLQRKRKAADKRVFRVSHFTIRLFCGVSHTLLT